MAKLTFFQRSFSRFINKTYIDNATFSQQTRPKFNLKNIIFTFGGLLVVSIVLIFIFIPNDDQRDIKTPPSLEFNTNATNPQASQPNPNQNTQNKNEAHFASSAQGIGYGYSGSSGQGTSRSRNANQIIKRGGNGTDPGNSLPMGTTIPAQLLSSVLSGNTASPVIAVITKEVESNGNTPIPQGARAIGNSTFNEGAGRMQIQFHTLVYEDGSEHSIQATAVMGDGSGGLSGDYSSGEMKRQAGMFVGNFVGGLADGMKDQVPTGGVFGGSITPGTLRNGLLNGVATSASDGAKTYSDSLSDTKPTMSIQSGFSFLLFLEKEYTP